METSKNFIKEWLPDDPIFWENTGKQVGRRNLWISIPCLLLGFCVWMLFSIVSVKLNAIGFNFSTSELFSLTAIPSISGALLRVPYSFIIPIVGGRRWTSFSTIILVIPCLWLAHAVQDTTTPYFVFAIIALLCGFGGANFASSMVNISFFFPKQRQGSVLGLNGGLGNLGVSVIQFIAPLIIFFPLYIGGPAVSTDGQNIWLQNAPLIWVPFLILFSGLAFWKMNDLAAAKTSFKEQSVVLKDKTMWVLSLLYLATFGSFIGFSAGFAMLSKTQFPDVDIAMFAFFGPLVGAIARPLGGAISDKLGGISMTFLNYLLMIIFVILAFLTLPGTLSQTGSFIGFYITFLLLFFTAGFGSGTTYQMIASVFRLHVYNRAIEQGNSQESATKNSITETAAALGFISAIGAMGGFVIPQLFSLSRWLFGSASYALVIFLVFYVVCAIITKFNYKP